jgi:hypothetical protein
VVMIERPEPGVVETVLSENRRQLLAELRPLIAAYETRYEIASADLPHALESGLVRDTEDVCDWVIAWETYVALTAGPARLE